MHQLNWNNLLKHHLETFDLTRCVSYSKGNEVKEAQNINMSPVCVYVGTVPQTYIRA